MTELLEHQKEAVDKMHNGCVLWGGVGTGKTIAALAYAQKEEPGKDIVVVTTAKKRDSLDWEKEAAKMAFDPKKFEVTSWNKINAYVDHKDCFFIFDEQRLVGAGAWVKAFYKIAKKNRWILLSATPGDTWSDYAPMFIANGWYKNITEFRREHAVYSRFTTYPKIERWVNEGKLQKYRKQLLVHMPMVRHTTRHIHHIECDYDHDLLDTVRKRRWNVYEDKPLLNAAELYSVMRKVVSTDPSRAHELEQLIYTHSKLIVFYNFNYELEMLRKLLTDITVDGQYLRKSSMPPSTTTWSETKSGLVIPSSSSTEMTKDSLLVPSRSAGLHSPSSTSMESSPNNGEQKNTSSEGRNELWESTTSKSSPATSRSQSRTDSLTASRHEPRSGTARRRPPSKTTRSSSVDAQPAKTAKLSSRSTASRQVQQVSVRPKTTKAETFGWAEWNGHKHEPIPDTDRWVYLVQYSSGNEGWNCTETDSMAFWSLTYSWKQFHQAQGRIDRLNTPFSDLHYYVLMTDSVAEKPVMRSLEQKKDFQPK